MGKVILFGAGQVASRTYWYLTHDSQHEVVAFTMDREYIEEDKLFDLPVIPFEDIENVFPPRDYKMFLHISFVRMNRLRAEKYHEAKAKGYELVTYISSKATTWPGSGIGDNCLIQTGAVIEPFAVIGNNVTVGVNALISHNAVIKDHCSIGHHAVILGNVTVEPYSIIGANATIRDHVTIAEECLVGVGALILENTENKGVYKGNPPVLLPVTSDRLKSI